MFDGSIKPMRVIRLSGASFAAKTSEQRGSSMKFDVYSSIRSKAVKRIQEFVKLVLQRKKDVEVLKIMLNSSLEKAMGFGHDLDARLEDIISVHPICRLMRVLVAIRRYDPKVNLDREMRQCLTLLLSWSSREDLKFSFRDLLSDERVNKQFMLLNTRFISSLFDKNTRLDDLRANYINREIELNKKALNSIDVLLIRYLYIVFSILPKPVLEPLVRNTKLLIKWYPITLGRSLIQCRTDECSINFSRPNARGMRVTTKELRTPTISLANISPRYLTGAPRHRSRSPDANSDRTNLVDVTDVTSISAGGEIKPECSNNSRDGVNLQDSMKRRLSFTEASASSLLYDLHDKLRDFLDTPEDAMMLMINFWSFPDLEFTESHDVLSIINCTISNKLEGCSGIGQKHAYSGGGNSTLLKYIIDDLTAELLASVKDQIPIDVSLNPSKLKAVEENVRIEIENDLNFNPFNLLHNTIGGVPLYEIIFNNLLKLVQYLLKSNLINDDIPTEAIFNCLLYTFYHFKDKPDLYRLQTPNNPVWTRLLCLSNLNSNVIFIIVLLIVPSKEKTEFTNNWYQLIIKRITEKFVTPESTQTTLELDSYTSNTFITASVLNILLKLFKEHYHQCCNGNIAVFYTQVSYISTALYNLWVTLTRIVNYALRILYDDELFNVVSDKSLMSLEDAVWLLRVLNYIYWYSVIGKSFCDFNYHRSAWFPYPYICSCGIEVKSSNKKPALLDEEYVDEIGKLAKKFNERFQRMNEVNESWIIPEAENAVLQYINGKTRDEALKVLDFVPHTISFKIRLSVLYHYIDKDKAQYRNPFNDAINSSVYIIRRQYIVEDGLSTLGLLNNHQLKQVFRVLFVDENGLQEQGVDGGGLFKEFLITLCTRIFDTTYGIFEELPQDHTYWPCPNSRLIHDNDLELFVFIGKIVGKAIYEQILIEPVLSRLLLNLILKRRNTLDDLKLFDRTIHKSITSLRSMTDEEIQDLDLSFTYTRVFLDRSVQVNLIPDGRNIKVTKKNVESFIHLFSNYKCNKLIETQSSAFLHGLSSIIPLEWLQMFSPAELELVISGSSEDINVEDLKRNTVYGGGFNEDSQTIIWFWEIMSSYDVNKKSSFLWFVTCCKRMPLLGFKQLQPPFCIHREPNESRLPTVSTCLNLLKLPDCSSKVQLETKIDYAMSLSKGFDLH